jgi:nucleoid-associated protein YgaU
VKKEFQHLILIALLLGASGAYAQEDLNEADLQTLLEDETQTLPDTAKNEGASVIEEPSPAQTGSDSFEDIDSLSSDTVDVRDLEEPATEPTETAVAPEIPAGEETATLEPLPESTPTEAIETVKAETESTTETTTTVQAPQTKPEEQPLDDDLEALKTDLADEGEFVPAPGTIADEPEKPEETAKKTAKSAPEVKTDEPAVFDVGTEERELLAMAQNIQGQISDNEWNELATAAKRDSYTVVKNDWLFKISKRLFGSGYYYPKIWALNSFITNPHFIEPGIVLSFSTGSGSQAPEIKLGEFTSEELAAEPGTLGPSKDGGDLANFAEEATPGWLSEKKDLENQGIYFQYASEETMDDLKRAGEAALNREYENYDPPKSDFEIIVPPKQYDNTGFDKNSKIFYSFKEGFYLSTFLSTNIVQDFGSITNGPDENTFFTKTMHAFVKFDETINALAGDKFSVYSAGGKITQDNSDREGYKYTIIGHVKLIRKIRDKWEVEFLEVMGLPQRGDRLTVYTPKIERITRTFNSRLVEAAIMDTFERGKRIVGFGDVVYLDRGRADGVELGNVFEAYGFKDRALNVNITDQPTYKLGELTVITLTDNFATALVTRATRDFAPGDIAMTKTKEMHLREQKALAARSTTDKKALGDKDLEELDVELNVDNLNDDLLKEADKIQLTEDELAELERQEREKSVIKDSERDLKALERLESEIESAEKILNDSKLDEDKLLEGENLEDIEKKRGNTEQDNLDEIEENLGKRYIDEDLNSKDNPYGLTEFDVEEVDELLNIEKNPKE